MKKIISFIIVLTMVLSTTTSFAAPDFGDFVDSLGGEYSDGSDLLQDVPVPTDISVKTQSASDFENGPLILSLYNANNTKFSFKASIDMGKVKTRYKAYENLANTLIGGDTALEAELDKCTVSGQFTITINYPTQNFTVNPAAKTDTAMVGFTSINGRHLEVFEEVSRNATTDGEIVITIKVKDGTTLTDLDALSDLYLTYDDNRITAAGEYTIRGTVAGQTTIKYDNEEIDEIAYLFEQEVDKENDSDYRDPADDISATVIVQGSSPSTSLGGGSVVRKTLNIMDGQTELSKKQYIAGTTVETGKLEIPQKDGYVFAGYYYDKELTKPVEEIFKLTDDTTIYVKWNECVLNETSHFAYIIGYPMEDGREEVRPENNMTREEIVTVFYRLLKQDVGDKLLKTENDFTDVSADRWSNKAISTIANGGYINGYKDGTFKPAQPITRAEFVTIATRFYAVDEIYTYEVDFTDVKGHWADRYINYATVSGWINGYEDGTFKPDQYITRAEVMKIINNMLHRHVKEEGLVPEAKRWVDNSADKWYYYEVIEATNFHEFDRAEGETYETWTEVMSGEVE